MKNKVYYLYSRVHEANDKSISPVYELHEGFGDCSPGKLFVANIQAPNYATACAIARKNGFQPVIPGDLPDGALKDQMIMEQLLEGK